MLCLIAALQISTSLQQLREGLGKDVQVLRQAYTQLHPGLYRYNTPESMEQEFQKLSARFSVANSLKEAYVDLSLFTASVRCGHTYPNFFNQDKDVVKELFTGQNRLPIHFWWLDRKMIVTDDLTLDHLLPNGTEIQSIDGIPCSTILPRMMKIARADGGNNAKRISILNVDGREKYEAFDIYLPMLFTIPSGSFQLTVKRVTGKVSTVTVSALSMEDRINDAKQQALKISKSGDRWSFDFIEGNIGRLVMPSWVMYDEAWDWKAYLAKTFRTLTDSKAKALIIDLRGNEGGSAVGEELCSYLVDRPTKFEQYKLYTRYTKAPSDLRPYLDTWDRSFDDWSQWSAPAAYVKAGRNEFHRMKRFDDVDRSVIQPSANRFRGKVLVLVDSSNSSATFEFENMVQSHHLATLIGEPTGGNQRGINGSAFYFLYLPNSKLEVDLPLVGQFSEMNMPDKGLTPEILVKPTVSEIAAGRDSVLERAIHLAGSAPEIR